MKKTLLMIVAAAAVVFAAFSCAKPYDDSELREKISNLETKVAALEKLQSQIEELSTAVNALKNGALVKEVKQNGDAIVITFANTDVSKVTITNSVIGVTEVDGVYYWTLNGQVIKDPAGNPIPVGTQDPKLRAAADGSLEYSVDGGKTWKPLAGKTEAPTVEETDDAYIIHFGETSFSLPKDKPFYIRFAVVSNFSIAYGETGEVKYEIIGGDADSEVGILAMSEGIEAELGDAMFKITNNNKTAESGYIIVYAANHKGKSDIKTFVFKTEPGDEPAEFEGALDGGSAEVPATGGNLYLNVKADEDYTVSSDVDWIIVSQPTRALYEDRLAVTVLENPTTEPRKGTITLRSKESDLLFAIEVNQAAGEEKPQVVDYMANTGYYLLEAHGLYNYIKSNQLAVKEGDVEYIFAIYPDEDGAEDYYTGALFENDGEEYPFVCYLKVARDEESGLIGLLACQNDEWENSSGETIYDWQYCNIYYEKSLPYITPGGETYVIGVGEPINEDGVITIEAGSPLSIQGFDDPFEINGVDVYGLDADGNPYYFYTSIPFPFTLTKFSELDEEEAAGASISKRVMSAKPTRSAFHEHSFTSGNYQMFAK